MNENRKTLGKLFFPIYLALRFPGSYSWNRTVCSFLGWILCG